MNHDILDLVTKFLNKEHSVETVEQRQDLLEDFRLVITTLAKEKGINALSASVIVGAKDEEDTIWETSAGSLLWGTLNDFPVFQKLLESQTNLQQQLVQHGDKTLIINYLSMIALQKENPDLFGSLVEAVLENDSSETTEEVIH